jgi:DNA-binding winged helix-turn-helix (wHTH) protein
MSAGDQEIVSKYEPQPRAARKLRFGAFEVDLQDRELRKSGVNLKLQQKPFQVLELLLRNPGALVTRTELAKQLWPDLHVNFDRSLNTAVNVLRQVLGDSPQSCQYIETRSGLGYRFIAPVEKITEPTASNQFRKDYTANLEAYQDYLKGRYFYSKMSEEDLHKSIAHFEAALRQDPSYSLAYTGLADAYSLFALLGVLAPGEAHRRAREPAMAALDQDEELVEAHASLATVNRLFNWDWPRAETGYLRALQRNPNYADGHRLYAAHLSSMDKPDDAIREIHIARELDPLSLLVNTELAWILYMARDFKGALEQSWKTLVLEARFAPAQHTLGLAYGQLGMHDEAITEFQNARACSGGHPAAIAALGHAYAVAGQRDASSEALRHLEQCSQRRYVSPYWNALVYAGLGMDGLALESLEKACQNRDVWLVWLKVEPRFDRLRANTRFYNLLSKLRLDAQSARG